MEHPYCTVEEALEELYSGRIIISIDDPDRENEGDMICAAQFATTENVNFMAVHAKGLICTPMSGEVPDRLGLEPTTTTLWESLKVTPVPEVLNGFRPATEFSDYIVSLDEASIPSNITIRKLV